MELLRERLNAYYIVQDERIEKKTKEQDGDYRVGSIPLDLVPEITLEEVRDSIDWEDWKRSYPDISTNSSTEDLVDAKIGMWEFSLMNPDFEGIDNGYYFYYDMHDGLVIKTKTCIDDMYNTVFADQVVENGGFTKRIIKKLIS